MSRLSSNPSGYTRKPEADLYTALLALALVAVIIGILCLLGIRAGVENTAALRQDRPSMTVAAQHGLADGAAPSAVRHLA